VAFLCEKLMEINKYVKITFKFETTLVGSLFGKVRICPQVLLVFVCCRRRINCRWGRRYDQ
jgi:hypothetical protein